MIWTMIKNNLKLAARNKLMIVLVILSPILVMSALSNAFNELLQNDYQMEKVTVGYSVNEDSALGMFLDKNQDTFKEKKISLTSCQEKEGIKSVKSKKLDAMFVEGNEVKVYSLDKQSIAAEMCQYILAQFYKEAGNGYRQTVLKKVNADYSVKIKEGSLESLKLPSAGNYYGIIEMVYFMVAGALFLTAVVQSERKNCISQRFMISPANSVKIYLSKFVPCVIMVCINTGISALAASFLFDVEWKHLPETAGIIFCAILGLTAFGIVCLYMVKNLAVSVILIFSATWVAGFIGGSFETYMFSAVPEKIKVLSPLYHINRTLVEYSTMGHSDYTAGCIIISLSLFAVFGIIGILLMKRRMEVE